MTKFLNDDWIHGRNGEMGYHQKSFYDSSPNDGDDTLVGEDPESFSWNPSISRPSNVDPMSHAYNNHDDSHDNELDGVEIGFGYDGYQKVIQKVKKEQQPRANVDHHCGGVHVPSSKQIRNPYRHHDKYPMGDELDGFYEEDITTPNDYLENDQGINKELRFKDDSNMFRGVSDYFHEIPTSVESLGHYISKESLRPRTVSRSNKDRVIPNIPLPTPIPSTTHHHYHESSPIVQNPTNSSGNVIFEETDGNQGITVTNDANNRKQSDRAFIINVSLLIGILAGSVLLNLSYFKKHL